MRKIIHIAIIGVAASMLSGCLMGSGSESMESLHNFVANGPKINHSIPPLPSVPRYHPASYHNPDHVDPFISLSEIILRDQAANESRSGPIPVKNSHGLPLTQYALSSLKLTGIVRAVNGQLWAVILTPKNAVYRATIGSSIGEHSGHVTSITETAGKQSIGIEQYIPNAFGGYKKEHTILSMQSPS